MAVRAGGFVDGKNHAGSSLYEPTGIIGTGELVAPSPVISATGTVFRVITGTGALLASAAVTSGSGVVTPGTGEITGSGALTAADSSTFGQGVVLQCITGSGIVVNSTSFFFNLDFVPVDGDGICVPTIWEGSTITVAPSGTFVISPALPNGTQFPRRSHDVSTGQDYEDTITINDEGSIIIGGTGALTASKATTSGTGRAFTVITGTGALSASDSNVSGSGFVTVPGQVDGTGDLTASKSIINGSGVVTPAVPPITGTGALQAAKASTSGIGAVLRLITGTGALVASKAQVSGFGTVTKIITGTGSLMASRPIVNGTDMSVNPNPSADWKFTPHMLESGTPGLPGGAPI